MKPAKNTRRKPSKQRKNRKPRILVLESGGGSATHAVIGSGAFPIRVNPRDIQAVDEALARGFDGLLLTGGGDVDPRLYGEKPSKQVYGVSETRDYTEWMALDKAFERGVPVMGICRGMQLIAVHNGGSLKQHVTGHRGVKHLVEAEAGSKFRDAIRDDRGHFESLHHQVVRRHGGKGMKVGARSPEGYIEAIESALVLAVQFHPEYDYHRNEASRRLFDWLARRAAQKAHLAKPTRVKRQESRHGLLGGQRVAFNSPRSTLPHGATKTKPKRQLPSTRTKYASTWVCRDCGLRFDKEQDRDDHEVWICGSGQMRLTEPPPGHPDWM
jgi:putative glutamine amidotransferase